MIFCSGSSILEVDPKNALKKSEPPVPQILRILIDDETDSTLVCDRTGATNPERIVHFSQQFEQNTISFFFTGIDATEPKGCRLEYRLIGLDSTWVEASNPGFARFSNLFWFNDYRFDVRASGLDGAQNPHFRSIGITIEPPLLLSLPFLIGYLAIIFCLFWAYRRFKKRQREQLEDIREQIASDLHDEVGGNLTAIVRAGENVADHLGSNEQHDLDEAQKYLTRIRENSGKAALAFRTAIWSVNPKNDNVGELIKRIRSGGAELCESAGIAYFFDAKSAFLEQNLNPRARHHAFLIFKEALNNAVKYADATAIRVELRIDDRTLALVVADDGKGFDLANAERSMGLNNMEKRASELAAQLRIESKIGSGTTVSLFVPDLKNLPDVKTNGVAD
jgi:hypothetical protein